MVTLRKFDPADFLKTRREMGYYLEDALHDDDPHAFADALGDVARAVGMSEIAREAGVTREGLYKSLSADGNPSFWTVNRVLSSLGLKLEVRPAGMNNGADGNRTIKKQEQTKVTSGRHSESRRQSVGARRRQKVAA